MALRNVTITLEEEVARWARLEAAERETSVARFVGEILRERMNRGRAYEAAMERSLTTRPVVLKQRRQSYPKRDQLHARRALR